MQHLQQVAARRPDILVNVRYRSDIDGLRALAVISVVVFHAFPGWLPGGFAGVDVFFVISGFLISGIIFDDLQAHHFSFVEFYQRRARRILPALIVVLISVWLLGWAYLLPSEFQSLGEHFVAAAGFGSNILLWTQSSYFDRSADALPLLHLWSLGVEEQFYLVWPLACFIGWKRPRTLPIVIVAVGLGSFLFNILTVSAHPTSAFYLPVSRFWELMVGSGLAYSCRFGFSQPGRLLASILSVTGALAVVGSFYFLPRNIAYPGWWGTIPVAGAAALIAAGPSAPFNRIILSNRAAVFIGLVSYPLYLWHWPLLSIARLDHGGELTIWQAAALCIVAFGLACVTYFIAERPLRFGSLRAFPMPTAAGLTLALAVVAGIGYQTTKASGYPLRFPEIAKLATYKFDYASAYRVGTCHLSPSQSSRDFSTDCYGSGPRHLVLWGDSKAADLYPGLKNKLTSRYAIDELTASGCPPILSGWKLPAAQMNCDEENRFILDRIKSNVPNVVILSMGSTLMPDSSYELLANTVTKVREAGVAKVIVVGLYPVWHDPLPELLSRSAISERRIPESLAVSKDYLIYLRQKDQALRDAVTAAGAVYVSPVSLLCSEQSCLATVDQLPVAWDTQHLTTTGSDFLAAKILPED